MDWKEMISGGKAALLLLVFTISVAVMIGINSFVGLFIGGSLQTAGASAGFSSNVQTGFNTTVDNLITNIGSVQTPFGLWTNLLSVILVLAVFAGVVGLGVYMYKKGDKDKGSGDSMGY